MRFGQAQALYDATQDVAAFFFARAYRAVSQTRAAMAAMVLPHSALQGGQFTKWRTGRWGVVSVDLGARTPWDLERIEPNDFFPVPASVVFLTRKDPPGKPLPNQADRWRGADSGPFTMEPVPMIDTSGGFASPYGERAHQGAIISPRVLFFVNLEESTAIVQAANRLNVSPRRSRQEKAPWRELELPQLAGLPIEAEHVLDVHLGETVAPYVLLEPLTAVLPLSMASGELIKKKQEAWYGLDPLELSDLMRRRWRAVNEVWNKHKSRNTKLSLLEQLDYMHKLSSQRPAEGRPIVRVVYATSGHPTASVLTDPHAVIDTTL